MKDKNDNQQLLGLKMYQETIKTSGDLIFVKPICDFFGINYANQSERIHADKLLKNQIGKNRFKEFFGDNVPRLTLTKKGFFRWIQILNPAIVRDELRENFLTYQENIFDYIYNKAIDPDEQLSITYRRLVKLRRLYGIIGNEIQRTDRNFRDQMENRMVQGKLNFNQKRIGG